MEDAENAAECTEFLPKRNSHGNVCSTLTHDTRTPPPCPHHVTAREMHRWHMAMRRSERKGDIGAANQTDRTIRSCTSRSRSLGRCAGIRMGTEFDVTRRWHLCSLCSSDTGCAVDMISPVAAVRRLLTAREQHSLAFAL